MPQSDEGSAERNEQKVRCSLNDLVTDAKEAKSYDIITLETSPLSEFTLYLYSEAVMSAEEEKCAWKIHASTQPLFNMQISIGNTNTIYRSINTESDFFRKLKCFDGEGLLQAGEKLIGEDGEAVQLSSRDFIEFDCDRALGKHSIYSKIKRITAVDDITSLQEFWRCSSFIDSPMMQDIDARLNEYATVQAALDGVDGMDLPVNLALAVKEDYAPQTIFDSIILQLFRNQNFDLLMKIGRLANNSREHRSEACQLMVYFFIKIIKLEKLEQVLQLGMSDSEKANDENSLNKVFLNLMSKPLVNTQLQSQYAGDKLDGHHLVYYLHINKKYQPYADLLLKSGWLVRDVVDTKLTIASIKQSLFYQIESRDVRPHEEYATSSDCSDDEDNSDEEIDAESEAHDARGPDMVEVDDVCCFWNSANTGIRKSVDRTNECVIA